MSDTNTAPAERRGSNLIRSLQSLLEWLLIVAVYLACGGALYVWLYDEPMRLGVWFWSFVLIWPVAIFFKFVLYVIGIIVIVLVLFLILYAIFGEK